MNRFSRLSVLTVAVFSLAAWPEATAAAWTLEIADGPGHQSGVPLVLDATGNLALAYGGDRITYANHDGTGWNSEVVAEEDCFTGYVGLAFGGPGGEPMVSYSTTDTLYLARRGAGGTWESEVVDASARVDYNALIADTEGRPIISYKLDGALMVARWDGAWSVERLVPPSPALVAPLTLDGSGHPALCYVVGSSRVDLQACKLEYSIVSPK